MNVTTKTYPPVFTTCNTCKKKRRFYFIRRDPETGRKYYACNDCGKVITR